MVGYLGEKIQEFAGDGRAFGLEVEYSFDGPQLLGTAGALRRALPMLGDAFAVIYGDSYLPCDYARRAGSVSRSGKLGLMTVFRNEGLWDTSNVEFADGRILATIRRTVRPPCATSITAWAPSGARHSTMCRPASPTTWRRCTRSCCGAASWRPGNRPSGSTRSAPLEGIDDLGEFLKSMTFTEQFLAEAAEILKQIDVAAVERVAATLAECRAARRAAVHPGRRRQRGQCVARGQRFPQDLRARSLRAHRQRLRTDRAHQRRRLGRCFEGWLRVSRLRAAGCAADLLGGRRQPGEARQPEPGGGDPVRQDGWARKSPGSSDATAATRRRSPTPA